jgi:hypothetical protein
MPDKDTDNKIILCCMCIGILLVLPLAIYAFRIIADSDNRNNGCIIYSKEWFEHDTEEKDKIRENWRRTDGYEKISYCKSTPDCEYSFDSSTGKCTSSPNNSRSMDYQLFGSGGGFSPMMSGAFPPPLMF